MEKTYVSKYPDQIIARPPIKFQNHEFVTDDIVTQKFIEDMDTFGPIITVKLTPAELAAKRLSEAKAKLAAAQEEAKRADAEAEKFAVK